MPKFSIIIPVYNVAPYLRECLDSVLAQSYEDWEVVAVDDGSTDGSSEILREYESKDSRFTVIRQGNAGVSAARNTALKIASGDYLVYVDGDDYLSDDYLRRLFKSACENGNPDLMRLGGLRSLANDGSVRLTTLKSVSGQSAFDQFCSSILINASLCFLVYKRAAFLDVRFPVDARYGEDDIYMLRGLSRISSFTQTAVDGYYYRYQRTGAASRTITCLDMSVLFNHFRTEIFGLFSNQGMSDRLLSLYRAYIKKNFFRVITKASRRGSDEMRLSLLCAIKDLGPFDSDWNFIYRWCLRQFLSSGRWGRFDGVVAIRRVASLPIRFLRHSRKSVG